MKKIFEQLLLMLPALWLGLLPAPDAGAIDFDEVRDFGDVFVISASAPGRDSLEVHWEIENGFYLYNNKFLEFRSGTEGVVLGEAEIPPGKIGFDDLLGEEVEKFYGELMVSIPIDSVSPGIDAMELRVRSQGCMEDELCYPPTTQVVLVVLPPAAGTAAENPANEQETDSPLLSAYEPPALSAEEAFVYEAIGFDAETALVRFTVQPGYYLYVDKFSFRVSGNDGFEVRTVELSEGVIKDDPEFGPVPVYYGQVEIPIKFNRPAGPETEVTLEADFQGCKDGDICYPPMSRAVSFPLPATAKSVAEESEPADKSSLSASNISDQDKLAQLLTSSPYRAIVAFFIAGLLLAFTPCVLPMIPILSGIIIGQGEKITAMKAFWLSLVYVLAMAVTYTVAGVLAGMFGQNLQAMFQNPWIISGFVVIFILLALSMFGFYELQLPGRLQTKLAEASNRQQGGHLAGVAVMGFLSALIVGPCVAPPLMAALIVIGSSGDAVLGGSALFALSMGMGLPLIVFGVSAGKLVPKAGGWMDAVKAVFGIAMLGLSIWMLERILPGGLIMVLWGALAIACGVYLGALERIEPGASGWRSLWKSLGVVLLVLGILELVGAAAGGDYWLKPLEGILPHGVVATAEEHAEFTRIKSLEDLDQALTASGSGGSMLDYYADWCVECKRMERNTFPEAGVQELMGQLQLLQADVTANDEADQALMKEFGVIGPPAILFFDRDGEEMKAFRLVGYFEPDEFSAHLQRVLAER
jgi:thiol:disulfide interchange protein DsbD